MAKFSIKGGIDFNNTKFKQGLKDSDKAAGAFTNNMVKYGKKIGAAFVVTATAKFAKAQIELATQIHNDAKKVRTGAAAYQAWLEVVEKTGGTASNALGALGDLQIRQSEAINGNAGAAKAFEDLGISMDQVSRSSMEELLDAVAKGTKATGNLAAAARVLGADNLRGVNIALNLVANDGMQNLIDQTEKAGRIFSEEFSSEAAEFSNFWKDMGKQFKVMIAENWIKPVLLIPETAKAAMKATGEVLSGKTTTFAWRQRFATILAELNKPEEDPAAIAEAKETVNDRLQAVLDANKGKGGGAAGNTGAAGAVQREYSSLRRIGANIIGNNRPRERHQDAMKKAAETQVKLQEEIRDNTAEAATVNAGSRF